MQIYLLINHLESAHFQKYLLLNVLLNVLISNNGHNARCVPKSAHNRIFNKNDDF